MRPRTLAPLLLAISGAALGGQSMAPVEPVTRVGGQSAEDLSAAWWQWAFSAPSEVNPVGDRSGEHCSVNQRGRVWFLAGGFGSSRISRRCEVPAGKHLFFPIINMVYYPRAANTGFTCEQARRNAALNNDTAVELFAAIDGVPIADLKRFRASTNVCFDILDRVPKEVGAYRAYPSASDGYWLLLPPLKKGVHTLNFGGRYNRNSARYGQRVQDIQYEITIK